MTQLQVTIDDGPQPVRAALAPLLAELHRRNLRAAFFNLGQEVEADPGATRDILAAGHTLGNHSWDHLEPTTGNYTDDQIKDQFRRCHAAVQAATQAVMQHWRVPRLEAIARLTGLLTQGPGHLYTLSHCDVHADSEDSQGANDAASMLRAIRADIQAAPNRTMFRLLFHVKQSTAGALRAVLDGLEQDRHNLVNFSQTA